MSFLGGLLGLVFLWVGAAYVVSRIFSRRLAAWEAGIRRDASGVREGCEEFTNIHGIVQMRFPRGNLMAVTEDVRLVLEREGILKSRSIASDPSEEASS